MPDKITSIGANRVPRVKDEDFDVSMLAPEDFEIRRPDSAPTPWIALHSVELQEQLISICVATARLCRIVSRILGLAYDENCIGHTGILYSTEEEQPPTLASTLAEKLTQCERELLQWQEQVLEIALHQGRARDVRLTHEQASYVHRALLSMLYFLAIFCIHHACLLADRRSAPPPSDE
jgi:hypothetical protein